MIVLAVLGCPGIAYTFIGSVVIAQEDKIYQPLLLTLGTLATFTVISAVWVFNRRPSPTVGGNIGRTVLGVLSISGAVLAVGFLLVVGTLILLFVVCLANNGKC